MIYRQDWLSRYQAGEELRVIAEIHSAGDTGGLTSGLEIQAEGVFDEMMRRVRLNIERIVHWLNSKGYPFDAPRHALGTPVLDNKLLNLESKVGKLPLSLRSFYRVVGSTCLMAERRASVPPWSQKPWFQGLKLNDDVAYADPLVIDDIDRVIEDVEYWLAQGESPGSFLVAIGPDAAAKAHKATDPYCVNLGRDPTDPEVINCVGSPRLVDLLRRAVRSAGFYGLDQGSGEASLASRLGLEMVPF
jgi:hypothetical protein